jgi:hypothetical protein
VPPAASQLMREEISGPYFRGRQANFILGRFLVETALADREIAEVLDLVALPTGIEPVFQP